MKATLIILVSVVLLLMAASGSEAAVEMKPTPVQTELAMSISSMTGGALDGAKLAAANDGTASGQETNRRKNVSVAKAAMLSALLPGLGEYYVGNRSKAKYFFGAEALTWVGFFAFRTYGGWKEDDMIRLAAEKADADLEDKDDEFLDWVGFYQSIDEFNTLGRVGDPDRPYLEDTPENHWLWLSDADREAYRELKNSSRSAYRRSDFMIGVAVVNRIISVIDAVRDAKRSNRRLDDEFGDKEGFNYRFSVDPLDPDTQVTLTIYTPF